MGLRAPIRGSLRSTLAGRVCSSSHRFAANASFGPNRPGSSVFNGAICNGAGSLGRSFDDDDRTLDATEMSTNFCAGPNATWAASLKGTRAGVPIGGDGGSCVAAAQRAGTGKGASRGQVVVPCRSLTQILSHHLRRKKIDFFSLDVETYDMEALRGLDFNAFDITSMLVECRTGCCRTHLREQATQRSCSQTTRMGCADTWATCSRGRPNPFGICARRTDGGFTAERITIRRWSLRMRA